MAVDTEARTFANQRRCVKLPLWSDKSLLSRAHVRAPLPSRSSSSFSWLKAVSLAPWCLTLVCVFFFFPKEVLKLIDFIANVPAAAAYSLYSPECSEQCQLLALALWRKGEDRLFIHSFFLSFNHSSIVHHLFSVSAFHCRAPLGHSFLITRSIKVANQILACFWEMGANQRTQRKPREEHAKLKAEANQNSGSVV